MTFESLPIIQVSDSVKIHIMAIYDLLPFIAVSVTNLFKSQNQVLVLLSVCGAKSEYHHPSPPTPLPERTRPLALSISPKI